MGHFLGEWLWQAINWPLTIGGLIGLALSLLSIWLLPKVSKKKPGKKKLRWIDKIMPWLEKAPKVSSAITCILIFIGLIWAPFHMYSEQQNTIVSLQRQLEQQQEQHRPSMTLGQGLGASTTVDDQSKLVNIVIYLKFRNIGDQPAYQTTMRVGFAPSDNPEQFQALPNLGNPNRIDAGADYGPELPLQIPFIELGNGTHIVPTKEILLFFGVTYSDSYADGNYHNDPFWLLYVLGKPNIAMPTMEQQKALEPYVIATYGNITQPY